MLKIYKFLIANDSFFRFLYRFIDATCFVFGIIFQVVCDTFTNQDAISIG